MIGNDRIEILVEYNIHGFDLQRVTIALEDMINAFGRGVFPAIYFVQAAGFVKTVGMQFVELIDIIPIAYDMVIGLLSSRRVEIADD